MNLLKSIKISKSQVYLYAKIGITVATLPSSFDGQTCLLVKMLDKLSICIPYYKLSMKLSIYILWMVKYTRYFNSH